MYAQDIKTSLRGRGSFPSLAWYGLTIDVGLQTEWRETLEVFFECHMVDRGFFLDLSVVLRIIGIDAQVLLTQVGDETIGFIEQIKRSQRASKVGSYHDDRSLWRHILEQILADFFFTGSDEQDEGYIILRVLLALHEIGDGEKTPMTEIAVVGRHTGNQSGFCHIALDIIGYRFAKGSITHMEVTDLTEGRG
jgi:hypothetical protein